MNEFFSCLLKMSAPPPPLIPSDLLVSDLLINGSTQMKNGVRSLYTGTVSFTGPVNMDKLYIANAVNLVGPLTVTSGATFGTVSATSVSVTGPLSVAGPFSMSGIGVGTAAFGTSVTTAVVSGTSATVAAKIFVTGMSTAGTLSVTSQTVGAFTVSSTTVETAGTFSWFVIN